MSFSNSGFARRSNGTCFSTETDCGVTRSPFHACCPSGSSCPHQYNVDCCPTAANCTESLLPNPQCANRTLDLYDNNGYFCCLSNSSGAASTSNSDICAEPGFQYDDGDTQLPIVSAGSSPSRFPSSSSTTQGSATVQPSQSTSPVGNSSHPRSSTSHAGAIAGGVIGFAAIVIVSILIWCIRRRRKQSGNTLPIDEANEVDTNARYRTELPVKEKRGELPDSVEASHRTELPDSTQVSQRTELPASTGELRSTFELSSHQNS